MEQILLPEITVRESGAGPELCLGDRQGTICRLTLEITRVLEQESLELSVWGLAEGEAWGPEPLLRFPKKYYCGTYEALLDLTGHPRMKCLRAHWDVKRWGGGERGAMFTCRLSIGRPRAKALAAG